MKVGVIGALGKMGTKVVLCTIEHPDCLLSFAVVKEKKSTDSNIPYYIYGESLPPADVIIDFSSREALPLTLNLAVTTKTPLVIGITGINDNELQAIKLAAKKIPVFCASNFSFGAALTIHLAKQIAPFISTFTNSITETHHIHKKDSPSGTAISLKDALVNSNPKLSLPIESIREGEVIGKHTLICLSNEEKITLSHESFSRDVFAKGALKAAFFLQSQKNGLYSMEDLFL
jgi:4-hydroxy-tetrahydrodipicolinate reductase